MGAVCCFVIMSFGVALGDSWHIESVDTTGMVGACTSIALDSADNPHISYFDSDYNYNLKYACYDGTTWHIETVDAAGNVGHNTSIALDSSDNPHISYYDLGNANLKYAFYDGASWHIENVDTIGDVGEYTSIALDSSDYPHISYYDDSNNNLKYARYDGFSWHIETVDTSEFVGEYTSIALDSADNPHISYYSEGSSSLMYARYDGTTWHIETVDTKAIVGEYTSIALDSSDNPHISYLDWSPNYDLKYARYDGTTWHIESADTAGYVGMDNSLALDSSDNPHISYFDFSPNYDLKYAWYGPNVGINLTAFSAISSDNAILLNWSVETTEGEQISGFNLYRHPLTADVAESYSSPLQKNNGDWAQINSALITGENPYTYTDSSVDSGKCYEYRLEAVLADETTETLGTTQVTTEEPTTFAIVSLYPNPSYETMTCLLSVPDAGLVELELYDLSGRMLLEKQINVREPNEISAVLDVSGLASGVYTLQATCGGVEASARCVVVR